MLGDDDVDGEVEGEGDGKADSCDGVADATTKLGVADGDGQMGGGGPQAPSNGLHVELTTQPSYPSHANCAYPGRSAVPTSSCTVSKPLGCGSAHGEQTGNVPFQSPPPLMLQVLAGLTVELSDVHRDRHHRVVGAPQLPKAHLRARATRR